MRQISFTAAQRAYPFTVELLDDRPTILAQSLLIGSVALTLADSALAGRHFRRALRVATALGDGSGSL